MNTNQTEQLANQPNITHIEDWLVDQCNQLAKRIGDGVTLFEQAQERGEEPPVEWVLLLEHLKAERLDYLVRLIRVHPDYLKVLSPAEQQAIRQRLNLGQGLPNNSQAVS